MADNAATTRDDRAAAAAAREPNPAAKPWPLAQDKVLRMQLVQAKYIADLDLSADELALLAAHPELATVSSRIIKTEEGRLLIRLHVRSIETALHGEPKTPLVTGHHA